MTTIARATSPEAPEPADELWSNCLVVGGVAYVSGQTARDKQLNALGHLDEYGQSQAIFTKITKLVEAAGGRASDIVKLTIFVTDIKNRELVWKARREFFTGNFPACSLVQVAALAEPAIKVEIEAVAHIGASSR